MKYKILLLLIISFFAFSFKVEADEYDLCSYEHIAQLKELANQVEVNYEYIDYSEEILNGVEGEYSTNWYSVDINLISDELYVMYNDDNYYYGDGINGIVNLTVKSGKRNFTIHSRRCGDYKLKSVSLSLLKFNDYSYKDECRQLKEYNLDVCDPWYQVTVNDNYFYNEVNKYLNKGDETLTMWDNVIIFLKNNYLIIIGGIIGFALVVVGAIVYRKRSVLE